MELKEGSLRNIVDNVGKVIDTYKKSYKGSEVHEATKSEIAQSPEAKEIFDKFTSGTKKSVKAYSDFTNNKIILTIDVSKLPSEVVSEIDPRNSKYFTKYDKSSHTATYEFPVSNLTKGDDVEIKDREITARGGDVEKEESVMVPTPTPYKLRLAHKDGSYLTDEEIDQWLNEELQMSAPEAYMNDEDYPYLKVNINGKDYSFEMKDDSPYSIDQMLDKVLKMQKYSLGKALQFMKKNMLGTRMESLEEATPAIEAPGSDNWVSVVDVIKNAYDEGKFGKLPCVGRQNACQMDISGVDKDRLISFFDKKKEFNREDHNEAGINSVEFISDKFDVEVFDDFIQIYIIPQYESIKRMTIDEFSDTVNKEEESLKEEKSTSLKSTHLCSGCGKPIGECTCDVEEDESKVDEALNIEEDLSHDEEDVLKVVVDKFGTTDSPYKGPTFILPNGLFLDLRKYKHHSDVEKFLVDQGYSEGPYGVTTGSPTLKSLGCVRCDTVKYYIALSQEPITSSQINTLLVWLDYLSKFNTQVEVVAPGVKPVSYSLEDHEVSSDYVVDKVRKYYSFGSLTEEVSSHKTYPRGKIGEDFGSNSATQSSSIGQHKVDSIDLIEEVGQWKELDCKQVPDSDGFTTDYTLYTDGSKFVCIFGDKEVYLPDDEEFDYETENEEDAREWFKNYEGLGDE